MRTLVFLLILLVACSSAPVETKEPAPQVVSQPNVTPPVVPPQKLLEDPVTRTVKQSGSLGTFVYGLSEDNRLLRVEKTGALWQYHYENGKLSAITGPQNYEFIYLHDQLSEIESGPNKLFFKYDDRGRLIEVKGFQETLYMQYDSLNRLHGVKRGVAGETVFDYDDKDRIERITRGPAINVFYDDKNRIRNFDADDTKFIIGYWRDDKVIALSGKTFGIGLSTSYGPDYPPFDAKLIFAEDDSDFTAAYTDTLYKVVDDYIYCKYVRRLKDVSFDGTSYAFFNNYFKKGLPEYLAMQFECIPYEN
ncbi:Uncharacterised protein [uncultured archaeon]|nr:Uncharacterised protein [uncultured archaeon]